MRGVVQLPDYLERLQGGHRDIPIVLLPLINDLRGAREWDLVVKQDALTKAYEVARLVDGSEFHEFKPLYGGSLTTGWANLHGYPIGILANARGVLFSEEAQKATQFIQLANRYDTPLLFIHNTTGYMVGAEYERGGMIKHGSMMINAVSNSEVPHLSLIAGASYGAGHYGMAGRAFNPRFLFSWPSARSAVTTATRPTRGLAVVSRK